VAKTRTYKSKGTRLGERLLADIDAGMYPSGSWLPAEAELCRTYGAARLTIRRMVDRLASQGVLERVPHRGVLVRGGAGGQATEEATSPAAASAGGAVADGGGPRLACILASPPDEGLVLIREGIADYAREHGLSMHLVAPGPRGEDPFEALKDAGSLDVDGVIVLPYPGPDRSAALNRLAAGGTPAVCVERRSERTGLPTVEPENAAGMYRAVNYLISKYRRPVYFLGMKCDHLTDRQRYDGYVRAMKDAGFTSEAKSHTFLHRLGSSDPAYWAEERKWYHGYQTAKTLLRSIETPASVACVKDYSAWGLYRAAAERKLVVGEDLAVTGFDDLAIARLLSPTLTTIHQPMRDKGYQAARLLHRRLTGNNGEGVLTMQLPVRLVVRESA